MELDDLKGAWAQYDKKLEENLKFNEAILRKMNLNASRKQLRPLIIIQLFLLISFIYNTIQGCFEIHRFMQMDNLPNGTLLISGMTYAFQFAGIFIMIFSLYSFFKIDFFGSSIVQIQKDIARIEKMNKIGLLSWFGAFVSVWILTILIVNLLNYKSMSAESISALFLWAVFTVVLCVVGVKLFRFYYDRKLKNIKRFLAEIEYFEKEE